VRPHALRSATIDGQTACSNAAAAAAGERMRDNCTSAHTALTSSFTSHAPSTALHPATAAAVNTYTVQASPETTLSQKPSHFVIVHIFVKY